MNYKDCTVEELAEHVMNVPAQSVSQMLTYHRNKGHDDIVEKIAAARKIARKIRLTKALEALNG